ncbi:MAG TPA: hypothetical protein VFW71_07535 [Actinomycetota bacterium]|nr:hypothetical protein [Actinomycetota bacterium]
MATPASRFRSRPAAERETLPLKVSPMLEQAPAAPPMPEATMERTSSLIPAASRTLPVAPVDTDAIEIDRVIPASGNVAVQRQQIWLGPARAEQVVTLWIDTTTIHVSIEGRRLKTLPSRLTVSDLTKLGAMGARPAGSPPTAPSAVEVAHGVVVEADRTVNACGLVGLGRHQFNVGHPLAGQRVTLRVQAELMQVIADGVLFRTMASPLPPADTVKVCGAPLGGPPPQLREGPLTVQRRVAARGAIMVSKQPIQVGMTHAGQLVSVEVDDHTFTVKSEEGDVLKIVARTTDKEVLRFKASGKSRVS